MSQTPLLSMHNITKAFPGVLANDDVSFDVHNGEVHTLLGENGAGKSTLMKILFGLYQPDEGEIRLRGEVASITSPTSAIEHRVGMVCLLYTSPSPRDQRGSRMPSSA